MARDVGRFKEGSVHGTNNFGDVEIIKWLPKNKRIIRFIVSGVEKEVSVFQLMSGSITDRVKDVYGVGKIFKTNKCGDVKIISKTSVNKRKIIFLRSKVIKEVSISALKVGYISDSIVHVYGIGKKLVTSDGKEYKIIRVLEYDRRAIKFLKTGNIKTVSLESIKSGIIKDKPLSKYGIGTVHKTNKCGNIIITDVLDYRVRVIKFLNKNITKRAYVQQIRSGELSYGNGEVTAVKLKKVAEDLLYTKKTQYQIAIENGISHSTVSQINTGLIYKNETKQYRGGRDKIRTNNRRS